MSKNEVSLDALMHGLWNDLNLLRAGTIDTGQAKSRAVLARTIIEARKLQLIEAQMIANGTPYRSLAAPQQRSFAS